VTLAYFSSGAAALLFETLWLRQAGLMLGNSVWASSIVLAAFMTGLAIGNAVAARWAARVARPLLAYVALEVVVGGVGAAVVIASPALTPVLAPLFRGLAGAPAMTHLLRLGIAFALVLLPTTAMGMTLPVLARALSHEPVDFGRVLGRLYGWNTLGGMLGAAVGELWLIGVLGLRGTALAAAGLDALAAVLAWGLFRRGPSPLPSPRFAGRGHTAEPTAPLGSRAIRLLAAAFVSGATLLALEVIWFRFLQLFVFGTTLAFAFMLAVILLGVGAGGLAASRWLRRDPEAHRFLPVVGAGAAVATTLTYAAFSPWHRGTAFSISQPDTTLLLSIRLMLPTSLVSGVLFTLQGAALRQQLPGAGETAGRLTLANTLGGLTGALAAGFVMLPTLGVERSIAISVVAYGIVVAVSGAGPLADTRLHLRRIWIASLAVVALAVLVFPRGAMERRHLATSVARFLDERTHVAVVREGVNQTTTLLRSDWQGETVSHRLVTNGHSMSATALADRRYMKMFVHWAVAVRPNAQRALLISHGLGSTAKALTDTRSLRRIDVVDISPEILALAETIFLATENPLRDPRVRVHVEDGRFYLQTTGEVYDLITGEPPPPKAAGIVNLYSREYFQLVRHRLTAGGVATYWLPVEELDEGDARAVVAAFCAAFADCSLWTGAGAHWMLAGTRGLSERASEEAFTAQWRDGIVGPELVRLGVEQPEQLGATFLADAVQLAPWLVGGAPLDDDHPHRLSPRRPDPARQAYIERWMEVEAAAARFDSSGMVRKLWPPALRARTLERFAIQRFVNAVTFTPGRPTGFEDLRDVLRESTLETLPLLMAGSTPTLQGIAARAWARGARSPELQAQLGIGALAHRDYAGAAVHFAAAAAATGADAMDARRYQAFALLLAEETALQDAAPTPR